MKIYSVVITPEAQQQLIALYRYIAQAAAPSVAERYTSTIVTYCEPLCKSPQRGTRRDDIRPGLRVTHYKGRAVIAFAVSESQVTVIGIYYGGLDYESLLQDGLDA